MGSSPRSSRFWKDWVAALRQEYSARKASGPVIGGSGSSSWPTVSARDGDPRRGPTKPESQVWKNKVARGAVKANGMLSDDLSSSAAAWSTPRASDGEKGGPNQSFGAGGVPLPAQASQWLTPMASDDGRKATAASHQSMLMNQAASWATPTARMYRGGGKAVTRKDGKSRLDMLDWQAESWPTPMAGAGAQNGNNAAGNNDFSRRVMDLAGGRFPSSALARQTHDGWTCLTPIPFSDLPSDGSISGPLLAEISVCRRWSRRSGGAAGWRGIWTRRPRRQLNVRFAEYLMSSPIGWTDCDASVTGYTTWLSDMRSLLSTRCSPNPPAQASLL